MAKLKYNESNLNAHIIPNLSKVSNYLRNAVQLGSMLSIPIDFKYISYLKSLDNNLKEELSSIDKINNILSESSKEFNNICNKIEAEIAGVENFSISLRQSIIK